MHLSPLLDLIRALPGYAAVRARAQAGERRLDLGLIRAARPAIAAALAHDLGRPTLIVAARPDRATAFADELPIWWPGAVVRAFPEPAPMFYEPAVWGSRTLGERIGALSAWADLHATIGGTRSGGAPTLITTASVRALMTRTLPLRDFLTRTRTLRRGTTVRLDALLTLWAESGYEPVSVVLEPGQFSRRGGIIDIWPAATDSPARIELFGDEIDTLRRFDPATQRSGESLETCTVTPAREGLAGTPGAGVPAEFQIAERFAPASLLDYLTPDALVLLDGEDDLAETADELIEHAEEQRSFQLEAGTILPTTPPPYQAWDDLAHVLGSRQVIGLRSEAGESAASPTLTALRPAPRYGGQVRPLLNGLTDLVVGDAAAVVVARQAARLAELWSQEGYPVVATDALHDVPAPASVTFISGGLSEGWRLVLKDEAVTTAPLTAVSKELAAASRPTSLAVLTDAEIFGVARPQRTRKRKRRGAPETNYAEFKAGDLIVHEDYGVGRFRELGQRIIDGLERDYLVLEFAEGDELYVPVSHADRLTRYVGASEQPPALSRLGSAEWLNAKQKAKAAVEQMARELLQLYARRELVPGRAFKVDTAWQAEMEGGFPFVETEDQQRAIRDVKADMQRPRPMDRLICGDVGFGKTEVALRAAFKAVMEGTQVAMLVPTTVLAQQHWHTFKARFGAYPVRIEMLSRFRQPREIRAALARLATGDVDIVIGTHRLLGQDVAFKDLGLLIIDEEQRFGVKHKERLKQMRSEVDVLTLTATPIPRTLYMSLTGLRDISTINTPPEERLPIITHVGAWNEKLARQAILRELERDGQIFYLHNRVQSIGVVRDRLARLVPEARVEIAHGQMEEGRLSHVMERFEAGEVDVLLCTSIIESGLDIPNANTLIVDRADTFGLAQLYQLRGRVGRSTQQAYAYFFTSSEFRPTPEARERLETLAEQTDLGAGYAIAMRDLEMRGAGDIIGPKQSGQITAVGFHLYTKMLNQAVKALKKDRVLQEPRGQQATDGGVDEERGTPGTTAPTAFAQAANVDLPLALAMPAEYVGDRRLRVQLYQRLANITDEAELDGFARELAERFGPPPEPAENLLYQLRVKLRATQAGVVAIASEGGQIVVTLYPQAETDLTYAAYTVLGADRLVKNRAILPRMPASEWRPYLLERLLRLK
ncbi:MAG: transcription-repair coupling factor [Anaerolineales bacterium]|nr:transcription-repair coupling factor [Anaerolineales bacterium]